MASREQGVERMATICCKTNRGVDLLHVTLTIDDRELEICGLARQELRNGTLWQWWIVMDA